MTHLSRDFYSFCAFFVNDDFPVRDFGKGLLGIVSHLFARYLPINITFTRVRVRVRVVA